MADVSFETAKKRASGKPLTVEIDGETFKFSPPKRAGIILAGWFGDTNDGVKAQVEWLFAGMENGGRERLTERLNDPGDPFELVDVIGLVNALVEAVAGRPTGRSPG
jgi:hypothetical protein